MRPFSRYIAPFVILFIAVFNANAQSCGFGFSKTITIDHNKVAGTNPLFDFPVLISLTDNDLRTIGNGGDVQNANGYDIYFLDGGSGQRLAHQIESYNATTGTYIAWVRVPVVYPDFDTDIQMVYGNSQINTDPSSSATWDNDYQAVWHLHNDLNDGTNLGNNGTNSGSTDITGKIADGQSFDGNNDHIFRTDANLTGNFPAKNSGSPNAFTLSGWIYVDVLNSRRPLISKQGEGAGNDRGFVFMMEDNNELKIEIFKDNISGNRTEVYSTSTLTTGTWYYMAVTYQFVGDGTSLCSVYLNGEEEGSTATAVGPIFTNARDLEIGRYFWNGGTNYWHDGRIDEVRVSDVVRSADWIATEFENQNDPSTFYTVGAEVAGTVAPVLPVCNSGYKKVITIDATDVIGSGTHDDFPVLISLTDNDLRTTGNGGNVENANGWDIVFTDNNLVPLDHDLESYTATNGELVAWVRVPALPTGTDYEIFMLYGNPDVYANPSTPCTWPDYHAVWHLHNDFLDATINDEDGTNNGSSDNTNSQIADGQSFDGNDFIQLASFPNLSSDFTISGWIRTTDNTEAGQRIFCDDQSNTGGYALSLADGGNGRLRFYSRSKNDVILDGPNNAIANNTWYYIAGVVDFANIDRIIYINGIQNAADFTDGGTWGTDAGPCTIGGETNAGESGNRFEGFLDEIRVASVVRSADWLRTEYNNQVNPANFYTVGAEEDLNVTSTQNGDWDQTATWAGGAVPGNGANVVIRHLVDLDDRDVVLCNLTIESASNVDSRLDLENSHIATIIEDVEVNGNGNGDDDATIRTNSNNAKMDIYGDLFINQSDGDDIFIEIPNSGDSLIVRGNVILTHSGGDDATIFLDNTTAVFDIRGNLTANMTDGSADDFTLDINSGLLNVGGFAGLNRSGTFGDLHINMDGGTFAMDSLYISSADGGGTDQVYIDIDGTALLDVAGNMYMQMGGGDDHEININVNNGTSGEFSVGGDFYWNKTGGDDLNINIDDINSELNVDGDFTIQSTGAEQLTLNMDDGTMTIGGTFTIEHFDGGEEFLIDLDGASILTANDFIGTLDNNNNQEFLIDLDETTQMNITGDMTITINDGNDFEIHLGENSVGSSAQLNVGGNLTLDHNPLQGGDDIQLIISDNCVATVDGVFTMDTDGGTGAGNFYTQINNAARLTVGSNIVFTGANGSGEIEVELNNTAELQIGGSFIRDATPNNYGLVQSNNATTTITYNGTVAQVFADEDGAGTDGIEYEQVVINNTNGTEPQLTMEDDVTLTNSLTLTDGVLETTSTELLTIADGATTNGGNAGSYVSGPLQKIGNDPFIYPLGKGGVWARLETSDLVNTNVTDAFTAEYFRAEHPESFWGPGDYSGTTDGLNNTSQLEYWDLNRDVGSAEMKISLYWENNAASDITDTAELVVAHYLGGSAWMNEGGGASGSLATGKVTSVNSLTSFSPFTFGSTTASVNPLPIELITFEATAKDNSVNLIWITASERNNDYFTIERSHDGMLFEELAIIPGAGNSAVTRQYHHVDENPFPNKSHYRLKQTDFDGEFSYSEVRTVTFDSFKNLLLYPNPASGTVYCSSPVEGAIFDTRGTQVKTLNNVLQFSTDGLKPGVYYVHPKDAAPIKLMVQ